MTWLTRMQVEEAGHDRTGRAVWEYLSPLVFRSEKYGDLLIPPTFRTNFVSVPRWPILFELASDKAQKPASLHDLAYTIHALLQVQYDAATARYAEPTRLPIDRAQADDLFLEALAKEPLVSEALAAGMHRAVRWFGQSSWDDDTNILQPPDIRSLFASPS